MRGFSAFLRKEFVEVLRTWRVWVLPGIALFFAVTGPPLAKYTFEILKTVMPADQAAGIIASMPKPTYLDSYMQWTKNLSQMVIVIAIVMFGGMISSEKRSGTATLVLTKPLSRSAFVVAKFISSALLVAVPVIVGTVVTWGMTHVFFGEAPAVALARATGAWLVLGLLFVALVELASAAFDSPAGAAGVGFAAYIITSVAAVWGPALRYSPAGLVGAPNAILKGTAGDLTWPIVTALALTAVFIAGAVLVFRRREI